MKPTRALLDASGLRMADVARAAQVSPQFVGMVLAGKKRPSPKVLAAWRHLRVERRAATRLREAVESVRRTDRTQP